MPRFVKTAMAQEPEGALLLDIGSGTGAWVWARRFRHFRLDIEARGPVEMLGDAHALPVRAGTVDLVLMLEVLEHVRDPRAVLGEVHRVLRPGGRLVFTVPFLWGIHESVDYWRYTAQGLRELLERAGFRVDVVEPRGGVVMALLTMLNQTPVQTMRRPWAKAVFALPALLWYLLLWLAVPLFLLADRLDTVRDFTTGYGVKATRV